MKTCLIVDDSRTIRQATRRMLEEEGFICTEAEDGQDALDKCQRGMPDAVLLDWNMPVMDGLACLEALRDMPGGAGPRVIFCTTENEMEKITAALDAGADEYIMKPFDAGILQSKLRQVGL